MNRREDRRSPCGASDAVRSPATRQGADDGAVLDLLSEILIGDGAWTLAEVERLISLRESAELGRWRNAGLDDATTAG